MSPANYLLSMLVVLVSTASVVQTEVRIKMCGRELIRLTVSTCGNSRLKRSVLRAEEGRLVSDWERVDAVEQQENLLMSPQSPGAQRPPAPAPARRWFAPSSRLGRSASKMADICCERGCSLRELIQFC